MRAPLGLLLSIADQCLSRSAPEKTSVYAGSAAGIAGRPEFGIPPMEGTLRRVTASESSCERSADFKMRKELAGRFAADGGRERPALPILCLRPP